MDSPGGEEERVCVLCRKDVDPNPDSEECFGPFEIPGVRRGKGIYIHTDCAIWTPEIFFRDGDPVNVGKAVKRGLATKCSRCSKYGATLACKRTTCRKRYHYECAVDDSCTFMEDEFLMHCFHHSIPDSQQECSACEKSGGPLAKSLAFCDTCVNVFHTSCLRPPLAKAPTKEWQCPACAAMVDVCERCNSSGKRTISCANCEAKVHKECAVPWVDTKMLLCGSCDTTYFDAYVASTPPPKRERVMSEEASKAVVE